LIDVKESQSLGWEANGPWRCWREDKMKSERENGPVPFFPWRENKGKRVRFEVDFLSFLRIKNVKAKAPTFHSPGQEQPPTF
jgi:hypothetical protein